MANSSVTVSGISDSDLAALQRAGMDGGFTTPSIDDMRYATQVAPAYTPAATPSFMETLPTLDEASNYLANLPAQAQRLLTNPAAFTEMLTGNNPLPEQAGFAASATGLPAQNPNSLFTPAGMAYNTGYESGEPVSIAAMGVPALAPAGRFLGSAAADRIMAGKALIPGTNTEYLNPQIMSAVKNKGGNWAQNSVNRFDALKYPIQNVGNSKFDFIRDNTNPAKVAEHIAELQKVGYSPEQIREVQNEIAINKWVDSKIKPYIRNEMGTPTDPVLALHEQGISHIPDIGTEHFDPIYWIKEQRQKAGMPESGFAKSPQAKDWENRADQSIKNTPAQFIAPGSNNYSADLGVLAGKNPDATVHELSTNARRLGFEHLTDELKNAIAHNSDLPAHLRLKPETLDKMTVPHAVKHVAKINKYRAEQMAQAAKEGLKDFPIVHEGGDGFKIHELKLPTHLRELDEGHQLVPFTNEYGKPVHNIIDKNTGKQLVDTTKEAYHAIEQYSHKKNYEQLDKALKNEGEQMGHCVGGYTDSVARGDSRIFSLRDDKGGAHATVEATPSRQTYNPALIPDEVKAKIDKKAYDETVKAGYPKDSMGWHNHYTGVQIQEGEKYFKNNPMLNIQQIKGKGNGAVSDKYRNYIKNWLNKEADKIGQAQDLDNIGVIDLKNGIIRRENLDPKIIKALESGELKRFASDDEVRDVMNKPNREQNLAKFLEPSVDKNIWYHTSNNPEIANSTIKPNVPNMGEHSSISLTATPESASSFDPKFKSFEKNPEHVENKAIYPVHVQVKKPFDYNNPKHFRELENYFYNNYNEIDTDQFIDELKYFKHQIKRNPELDTWETMESYPVQKAIRDLGYDGFFAQEDRNKNLAVFSSNQIKSKHGNEGTYDVKNHLMHKKTGGRVKMAEGGEPPKLTPFEQFKIDNAERIRQGQEDIANRNKYNPYKGSDRPVPTSKGMSGGAGYVPGTTNPFNPDSPLNRKNGGKIPSIDEMRLTILRNK